DAGALVTIDGQLRDGEVLVGNTYLALGARPVRFGLDARQLPGGGWAAPRLVWQDADTLSAEGSAMLAADGGLEQLELDARSPVLDALPGRYLSGWLGLAGLSDLELEGSAGVRVRIDAGELRSLDADLAAVDVRDPQKRFRIDGLQG